MSFCLGNFLLLLLLLLLLWFLLPGHARGTCAFNLLLFIIIIYHIGKVEYNLPKIWFMAKKKVPSTNNYDTIHVCCCVLSENILYPLILINSLLPTTLLLWFCRGFKLSPHAAVCSTRCFAALARPYVPRRYGNPSHCPVPL